MFKSQHGGNPTSTCFPYQTPTGGRCHQEYIVKALCRRCECQTNGSPARNIAVTATQKERERYYIHAAMQKESSRGFFLLKNHTTATNPPFLQQHV